MIDPELAAVLDFMPVIDLHDPALARAEFEKLLVAMRAPLPEADALTIEDRLVPGWEGDPDVAVSLPPGHQAVLDIEGVGLGQRGAHRLEHLLELRPRQHRVVQVDDRHDVEDRGQLRVDHVLAPSVCPYFGCMRMPASIRIDSALTYELVSSSSARVANSAEYPRRCGNSTSWASLPLKASDPSPAP